MKKNLISVLIMALVAVNTALTALLLFTVMPQAEKANELITKVASAIDLELRSGQIKTSSVIPIDDIEVYELNEGNAMLINLLDSEIDGSSGHHAQLAVSLSLNTKDNDYETGKESLTSKEALVKDAINRVIGSYTPEALKGDQQDAQMAILKELQSLFDDDFIVGVSFPTFTVE